MNNDITKWSDITDRPITSYLSYLIGVPRKYMREEECIEFGNIQRVRAIRHLNQLRTQIMRNFSDVSFAYKRGQYFDTMKSTGTPFAGLKNEGIRLDKQGSIQQEIIQINNWIYGFVSEAIEPLKPFGINPDWLKDFIVMPEGNTIEGVMKAIKTFSSNINYYPYQMYCNWAFQMSSDSDKALNLLRSDETFISEINARYMPALKNDEAREFCKKANRLVMMVDCENVDPIKLYGMICDANNLKKVVLVDDENASSLWIDLEYLVGSTGVEVERIRTNRLNQNKSVVDLVVVQKCCEEYYQHNSDAIIIASSDSDYLSVITNLAGVHFAVTLERSKTAPVYIEKLMESGVQIWSLDRYPSSQSPLVRSAANRLGRLLSAVTVNMDDVVKQVTERLHIWSETEMLEELKSEWINSATLVKNTDNNSVSIVISDKQEEISNGNEELSEDTGEETEDEPEDEAEDSEEKPVNSNATPKQPVKRNIPAKKTKKASKKKSKKKKK